MNPAAAPGLEAGALATSRSCLVVLLSSLAIVAAGATPPAAAGARSLTEPVMLTAGVWTAVAVLAAWPGRIGVWSRVTVLALGVPAAFVLGLLAVVPSGSMLAALLLALSALPAGEVATRVEARGGAVLGVAWIALPAVGLGLVELGVSWGTALLVGSPLVGPTVLAHASAEFSWFAALPACCANLAVAAACARAGHSPVESAA